MPTDIIREDKIRVYSSVINANKGTIVGNSTLDALKFTTKIINNKKTKFRFICVSETWLNQDSISYSSIDGYNAEHSVRNVGCIGGGASVYVYHTISYGHRTDLSMLEPDIESCFIEVVAGISPKNY